MTRLADRALIHLSGEDVRGFLQEVIDRLPNEKLRGDLTVLLEAKLSGATAR